MNHSEASTKLPGFVSDSLEIGQKEAVREHIAHCQECRDWLATSRFLGASLAVPAPREQAVADPGHIGSEQLALLGLMPEGLSAEARERCARHLEVCCDCRRELELLCAAAQEARETPGVGEPPAMPRILAFPDLAGRFGPVAGTARPVLRTVLAAGLVIAVGSWLVIGRFSGTPDDRVLSGAVFVGEQTVSARRSIVVDDTSVQSGARLVLAGGDSVAFGDGFSVGSGATLTVSTLEQNDDDS